MYMYSLSTNCNQSNAERYKAKFQYITTVIYTFPGFMANNATV